MARDPRSWPRLALVVVAFGIGVFLRTRGLTAQPLFGDEYHTVLAADRGYGELLTTFDTVGSHAPLPLIQRLSLDLFGNGVLSFRLVALVPGLLTLLLAYPLLTGFVGAEAGALATLVLALSPVHVYYSRFARGYALVVLLALLLVAGLRHLLAEERHRRIAWAAVVGSAALLPWVHLSSAGFVATLGLTAIALGFRISLASGLRLIAAFALAAASALLLYLPLIGQVRTYFSVMVPEEGPLGWFGIPTLLAGGRLAAGIWLLALPVAFWALRGQRTAMWIAAAAVVGPLVFLLATRPRGMDYAWSRYLLSSLPILAALVSAAFLALFRRLPAGMHPFGLGLGALILGAQHLTGPLAGSQGTGAFDNTYLAMHGLEAFDEPFSGAPEIYRTLAEEPSVQRIIEAPVILSRAVLLLRAYARSHGKEVLIGWVGDMPRAVRGPPYVSVFDLEPRAGEWLILHRDFGAEVHDYFSFVYREVWPRDPVPADASFMRRQETVYGASLDPPERTALMAGRLFTRLGPADFKDGRVLGWNLDRSLPETRDQ